MRLSLFRELPAAEQKKEVARSVERIQNSHEKLCKTGVWYPPKTKDVEYKNGGVEYTLWKANAL